MKCHVFFGSTLCIGYPCKIILASAQGSGNVTTKIIKNCWFWPLNCCSRPLTIEPPHISAWTLYHLKEESLGCIFAADSMGLLSDLHSELREMHYSVQQRAVRLFIVIQGRWFWDQLKGHVGPPITDQWSVVGPVLHSFWDTAIYWLTVANFSVHCSCKSVTNNARFHTRAGRNALLGLHDNYCDDSFRLLRLIFSQLYVISSPNQLSKRWILTQWTCQLANNLWNVSPA